MSEVENEVEVNPIEELINAIAAQNFNQAQNHFNDIIGDKMTDALDQEKITVANQIFNDVGDQEEFDFEEEDESEEESEDDET